MIVFGLNSTAFFTGSKKPVEKDAMTTKERRKANRKARTDRKQYMLTKQHQKCAYCGISGVPMEREHVLSMIQRGYKMQNQTLYFHVEHVMRKKVPYQLRYFFEKWPHPPR